MKEGKLSNALLQTSILDTLNHKREDILIGPGVGEDCGAIAFGDLACVLTTDPITGATKDLGKLAVHISCNDIASSGVRPVALLMTLLLPLTATKEDANLIMSQAQETAQSMDVAIIGGHTEFTSAVNRTVVSVTAIGKGPKERVAATGGARAGDLLVISKWAALEGTAIIANEKASELIEAGVEEALVESGKNLIESLSVLPEGLLASEHQVSAMHDVTEGGVYGAIWEMCQASGLGAVVKASDIPLMPCTQAICKVFDLDPYRLISSGVMLMAFNPEKFQTFKEEAEKQGILVTVVGALTSDERVLIEREGEVFLMEPPAEDELYKIFQ